MAPSVDQVLETAHDRHQQGQFTEAESLYRRVLATQPEHPDALHLLGVLAYQVGKPEIARQLIERAIAVAPSVAEMHLHLGLVLQAIGLVSEAISSTRNAIQLNPRLPQAHFAMGGMLHSNTTTDEAITAYRTAIALDANFGAAYINLGGLLIGRGDFEGAIAAFREAIRIHPEMSAAHANLGVAFLEQGMTEQAVTELRLAARLDRGNAEIHDNLGRALRQSTLDGAIAEFQAAIQLRPDLVSAHNNLGNALKDRGELDEAIACYRRAISIQPDFVTAHDNLLYCLTFAPQSSPEIIASECRRWSDQHVRPLESEVRDHVNSRDPNRKLRIGYVSPDFRWHAVARFLIPLLEHHDTNLFDVVCYSSVRQPDSLTGRIRKAATVWRDVASASDNALAQCVRDDRIDILVDLSLHMAGNRLLAFARKPAPVQVTYLGYAGTSGMSVMDYRLTDPFLDPDGNDEFYTERSIRLPQTYWCYGEPDRTPDVASLPASSSGRITFGCLNNFCKATVPALKCWANILRSVPGSRMILHAPEGSARQRVLDLMSREGVDAARLRFAGFSPWELYIDTYQEIDIALDPFPYAGGTTTCDALWMGVPVVTLAGRLAVHRSGLSILSNVGLAELTARTEPEYQQIAQKLACDLPRVAELRRTMRDRMRNSPLMNARRFATDVESAYRFALTK